MRREEEEKRGQMEREISPRKKKKRERHTKYTARKCAHQYKHISLYTGKLWYIHIMV